MTQTAREFNDIFVEHQYELLERELESGQTFDLRLPYASRYVVILALYEAMEANREQGYTATAEYLLALWRLLGKQLP